MAQFILAFIANYQVDSDEKQLHCQLRDSSISDKLHCLWKGHGLLGLWTVHQSSVWIAISNYIFDASFSSDNPFEANLDEDIVLPDGDQLCKL